MKSRCLAGIAALGLAGVFLLGIAGCAYVDSDEIMVSMRSIDLGAMPAAGVAFVTGGDDRHVAYVEAEGGVGTRQRVIRDGVGDPWFAAIPRPQLSEAGRAPQLIFSPNGLRLAYLAAVPGGTALVVDGHATAGYEGIAFGAFAFSPDSKCLGWIASRGGKEVVVIDDGAGRSVESPPYDSVAEQAPHFSKDSRHFWYTARRGDQSLLIFDGRELAAAAYVGNITFSRDESRLAYVVRQPGDRGKWQVVVDGIAQKPYIDIGNDIFFSPDDKHVLYRAGDPDQCLVLDGVELPRNGAIREAQYGFDPKGVPAYVRLAAPRQNYVVHGAAELGPYDDVFGSLIFSADGRRMAFCAQQGNDRFMVIDGRRDPPFEQISEDLQFSPDGRHTCYVGLRGSQQFLVVDGSATPQEDGARHLFAPDGALALVARRGEKWAVLWGGRELPAFDSVYDLTFSAAGRLAYIGHTQGRAADGKEVNGRDVLVVDGRASQAFAEISAPQFTLDGKHLLTIRRTGNMSQIYMDEMGVHDAMDEVLSSQVIVDGAGSGHLLARRGQRIVRVELQW